MGLGTGKDSASPNKQKSYSESQDSSFACGVADHNYDSMSVGEDDEDLKDTEESKELALGQRSASLAADSLPDMWNQTDAKRGDGYFIFGAPPKKSGSE